MQTQIQSSIFQYGWDFLFNNQNVITWNDFLEQLLQGSFHVHALNLKILLGTSYRNNPTVYIEKQRFLQIANLFIPKLNILRQISKGETDQIILTYLVFCMMSVPGFSPTYEEIEFEKYILLIHDNPKYLFKLLLHGSTPYNIYYNDLTNRFIIEHIDNTGLTVIDVESYSLSDAIETLINRENLRFLTFFRETTPYKPPVRYSQEEVALEKSFYNRLYNFVEKILKKRNIQNVSNYTSIITYELTKILGFTTERDMQNYKDIFDYYFNYLINNLGRLETQPC